MKLPVWRVPPALKHRRYALLWFGLLVSVAGSQMQLWAIFWHIRDLSDQPIAIGLVGLARFLPIVIFSLIGGLVADLYNRRKIMFLTQSAAALLALALGVLTLTGEIQLGHIYFITALQAGVMAFDLPARQSLIPNLVPRADLPSAFSVNSIAFDLGAIVGPALSGLVIATMGQQATYFINAVSFGAVLLALVLMGPVPQSENAEARKRGLQLGGIAEGVRFILKKPIIISSMILDFFATFFSSANTLLPFVARDILNVGAVPYGWLSAAQSLGAVVTAAIISQKINLRKQGPLLLWSVVVFGVATVIFGLSQNFWLTMLALIIMGSSDTVSMVVRNTIRQLQTPDRLRGRMVSINQIFFAGGPQLGEIESGLVAQIFSTPVAIITGGLGCIFAAAVIPRVWPQLGKYDQEDSTAEG